MPTRIFPKQWRRLAGRPQSIRHHLAGVFLVFFLLVCVLGSFSIWRLSNFNRLMLNEPNPDEDTSTMVFLFDR